MTEQAEITIITPPVAESAPDTDLVNLTEYIWKRTHGDEPYFYGLGGEYGYGVEFANDVFEMFPFYWGECECGWEPIGAEIAEEPHDDDCYQAELDAHFQAAGLGYDRETWRPRNPDLSYDDRRAREEVIYRELTDKYRLSMHGCAVHCTCTRPTRYQARFDAAKLGPDGHALTCGVVRPNFVHKPSGIEVRWYKWIGRDMEWSRKPSANEWRGIFAECVDSLDPAADGATRDRRV